MQLVEQAGILDGNHRLVREGGDEIDFLLREWIDRDAGQDEHADRSSLAQQWNAERGTMTAASLNFVPGKFRIGQDVRDVNRPAFERGSTGDRPAVDLTRRESRQVLPIFGSEAEESNELELVATEAGDARIIRSAEPCRRLDERVEHRLQIEGRTTDDLEHLGRGGLLLQRFTYLLEHRNGEHGSIAAEFNTRHGN